MVDFTFSNRMHLSLHKAFLIFHHTNKHYLTEHPVPQRPYGLLLPRFPVNFHCSPHHLDLLSLAEVIAGAQCIFILKNVSRAIMILFSFQRVILWQ